MSVVYCCQYNVVTFISLLYPSFYSWSSDWLVLVIRSPEHALKGVALTLNPFTSNKTNGEGDERSYTIINQIGLNALYIYFIVEIYALTLNNLYEMQNERLACNEHIFNTVQLSWAKLFFLCLL